MVNKTGYQAGYAAYVNGECEHVLVGKSAEYDRGYWDAHNDSATEGDSGFEVAYGDYLDYDAVMQGLYDSDPDPYAGTYSEM